MHRAITQHHHVVYKNTSNYLLFINHCLYLLLSSFSFFFFFLNVTAPTDIYPLPLHAALPIGGVPVSAGGTLPPSGQPGGCRSGANVGVDPATNRPGGGRIIDDSSSTPVVAPDGSIFYGALDRKSTRLNSSHSQISYAVFCLKK